MTDASTEGHLVHVVRGGVVGLAGSAASAIGGFALAVVVTRGFDPADAGRFFTVTSVFAILVTASTLGTDSGLSRFLLRLEAHGRACDIRRVVTWAVVPTALVGCAWSGALLLAGDDIAHALGLGPAGARLLGWVALALPAAVVAEVLLSTSRGFGHVRTTVVVDRLARPLVQLTLAVLVVAGSGSVAALVGGWAGAYLVSAALALVVVLRFVVRRAGPVRSIAPSTAGRPVRAFWAFTWPRGIGALAQMGIQKVDIIVVALLLSPVSAALYAAATRFVPLGQMAVQSLQQVLQPRFTAILLLDDRDLLRDVFRVVTSWSILLAWPLYLCVACAPGAYLGLFGGRYADASPVVLLMGAAMLVAVATGPVDTLLLMAGRSALSMANAVAALLLDVVLCLVLVPRHGITGAAVAWAAAVALRCCLATWQVGRDLGVHPGPAVMGAAALPTLCFGLPLAALSALTDPRLPIWLAASLAGAVAYVVLLWRRRKRLSLDLLVSSWRRGADRAAASPLSPALSAALSPPPSASKESEEPCDLETPRAR